MLFAGMDYEAAGGIGDFVCFIDKFDVETALEKMRSLQNSGEFSYCDWSHIYDIEDDVEIGIPIKVLGAFGLAWCYGN
jgi:hypothetical protein